MNQAASLCALLLLSHGGMAQTYRIQIKDVVKGLKRQTDAYEHTRTVHKVYGPDRKLQVNRAHSSSNHAIYHEVILDQAAGAVQPSQIRRYYFKAISNINGKEEVLPYQKKWVSITKKQKGPYLFQIEKEKALKGVEAHLLQKEFNAAKAFDLQRMVLPDQPVKVNDTWKLNMADIARNWQKGTKMSVDIKRSSGTGKLTRVYQKEGRLYGVLTFHLEMPLTHLGEGQQRAQMATGSRMAMDVVLDACIDGSVSSGSLKGNFEVKATSVLPSKNGGQAQMQLTIQGSMHKVRTEIQK